MDIDDILAEVDANAIPQETLDLRELTRSWTTERAAPEVLPFAEGLLERVMERIRRQVELVEMQTGNMDPKTNFRLIIMQTELERFKFLVRSYLRARLQKIDKYALDILSNQTMRDRLAPSELNYLKQHQALLNNLYQASFLRNFPEPLRRLDDTAGGISMVEQPDLDKAIFCRVLRDVHGQISIPGTDTVFDLKRGDTYVVRYSAVREYVLSGHVELI